jgi:drug/metabolite transporter (DMT)-like permease
VLGSLLAVLSAATFAFNNAALRRGVLSGSVIQALAITVPIGVPIFFVVAMATGGISKLLNFPTAAIQLMAMVGVLHFIGGRYCNYRSTRAIGANLSAPVIQLSLIVTLVLAIAVLHEQLTPLRLLGIALLVIGPMLTRSGAVEKKGEDTKRVAGSENAAVTPTEAEIKTQQPVFKPRYLEGYVFGLICAVAYGTTPIMVRMALDVAGPGSSFVAGIFSYGSATVIIALSLLWPGQWQHVTAVKREAVRWFVFSGVFVCLSQMFIYLAYSIAPVSVVTPLLQLQLIFRFFFSHMLNPDHEVFGGGMVWGTIVSLLGAVALSVSTDLVLTYIPLPESLLPIALWHWP